MEEMMKEYEIYLDDFCEEIFHEMEKIQDGTYCHTVMFQGKDKLSTAEDIAIKLIPFLEKQLKEQS
jgi:hypothetical protein